MSAYMQVMSHEDVHESERRVRALYRSRSLVRNVAAILMDCSIGGSGDTEETALTKAQAIVNHLRKHRL